MHFCTVDGQELIKKVFYQEFYASFADTIVQKNKNMQKRLKSSYSIL